MAFPRYRSLAYTFPTLAVLVACFSEPPRRPAALDPSNPNAPESAVISPSASSASSVEGNEPAATEHHHQAQAPAPAGSGKSPGSAQPAPSAKPGAGTVYTCPMHPDVTQSAPGRCPKCGMELVPRAPEGEHQHVDHGGM